MKREVEKARTGRVRKGGNLGGEEEMCVASGRERMRSAVGCRSRLKMEK